MTGDDGEGRYRRRPGEVEAIRWTGENPLRIGAFARDAVQRTDEGDMVLRTLHGLVTVAEGAWIVKGALGDFWPCDDARFHVTYERVWPSSIPAGG